jgi:hypothetical protein
MTNDRGDVVCRAIIVGGEDASTACGDAKRREGLTAREGSVPNLVEIARVA